MSSSAVPGASAAADRPGPNASPVGGPTGVLPGMSSGVSSGGSGEGPPNIDIHPNLVLKALADELPVHCPHRKLGCVYIATRDTISAHADSCVFRPVHCPNQILGCAFEVPARAIPTHMEACVYEMLKPFVVRTTERIAALEDTVASLQKQLARAISVAEAAAKAAASTASATAATSPSKRAAVMQDLKFAATAMLAADVDEQEEAITPAQPSFPFGHAISCRRTISDNTTGVTALAYVPATNSLFSGAYDGSVKMFDAESGRLQRNVERAHDLNVWALAVENNIVYSASSDGKIKVWDMAEAPDPMDFENTQEAVGGSSNASMRAGLVKVLPDHETKVYSLQVNGSRLYSAASDGKIKIWSTEALTCETTIQAHSHGINSIVFVDTDPTQMVSVSHDRTVKLWDLTTATCVHTFSDIGSEALDVTTGGGMIFASTFDASILAFDRRVDPASRVRTLRGHNWEVWQVKYIDGLLFSGSHDHTIKRWDLSMWSNDLTLKGHKEHKKFGSAADDNMIFRERLVATGVAAEFGRNVDNACV
ncbi:hypothetical protein HDU82_007797 [Entophlyctis luteolus]|nr:hypothetical protein HDU82_007797 [Entophlyctis luteolus]